jgi:hypothetical protein
MSMTGRFTVFIDESGEAGLAKIRSSSSAGASPYMTLGASLISNRSRRHVEETLIQISKEIGKSSLHCSQLKHYDLLHFSRHIVQSRMRLFGVISRKATLGSYRSAISNDSSMYYNKCAQYLLERVGWFMSSRGIIPQNLDIVFEKANVDYNKMRNLLWTCQSSPVHEKTKYLKNIDISKIQIKKKSDEPLLQIADLVAHSLYKCVEKQPKNYHITEPRYVRELGPRFFGNPEDQTVVGAGIYCVHSLEDLKVESDVRSVLEGLVAMPPN